MQTVAYLRVSKTNQDIEAQRISIVNYSKIRNLNIDKWIEVKISSSKKEEDRMIGELYKLNKGDIILIAEISRLARSINQLTTIVKDLTDKGIIIVFIKEQLELSNSKMSITNKIVLYTFGILAEVARDLHSMRVKEGLQKNTVRKKKKRVFNKLTGKGLEIKGYLELGLSKRKIAKRLNVTINTLDTYLKYFYENELNNNS
jgi:DNA invertase Pin-like site-specific DNA recombinase